MKRKLRTSVFKRSKLLLGSFGGLGLLGTSLMGQTAPRPTPLLDDRPTASVNGPVGTEVEQVEAVEYLTRGPLHAAFAEPYEADPRPSPVVRQQPPEAINEIPPDYRPDGENVAWIPGYWAWDEDRSDFIWISGVWRDVPPHHQWVPGYWSQTSGGYQFVSGFWASTQVAELEYLPPPPNSLEEGPSSPAPGETYFYIPGHWVYSGNDYQWQPGYWAVNQENWVWNPAHYVWTPRGCVYQAGYWDYDIPYRGVVFTPVYYQQPVYRNAQYSYRPQYVVETGLGLFVHLFVRPNYGQYYFGDYYGPTYTSNYQPWSTYYQGQRSYDPFYTNYRVRGQAGNNVNVLSWIVNQHQVFAQNDRYRPAATIAAQRNFLNASGSANLDQTILRLANLGDSLDSLVSTNDTNINFQQLNQGDIDSIVRATAPLLELGNQRLQVEGNQNADANANANANARVSLAEARQQSLEANASADAKADVNVDGQRGNNADSSGRGLLGEQRRPGLGRDTDPRNATDPSDTTTQDPANNSRGRSNPNATRPQSNDGNNPGSALPNRNKQRPDEPGNNTPNVDTPNVAEPNRPVPNLGERGNLRERGNRKNNSQTPPLPNSAPGSNDPQQPNRGRTPSDSATEKLKNNEAHTSPADRGPASPRNPLPDSIPGTTPNGEAGTQRNRGALGNGGAAQQMRPARPQNWPAAPRRETGRSVPELPKSQSSAPPSTVQPASPQPSATQPAGKSRDGSPKERRPAKPAAAPVPALVNPPSSPAPNAGSGAARKASAGNKGNGGENKDKDNKKDKNR